jgi:DNA-binding response OmpR family regulator
MARVSNRTLLIVEDDADMAFFLMREVRKILPEWNVCHALDGQEAVSWLDRSPLPDFVITDLHMPRMDRFSLIEWTRREEMFHSLPIFVLSSSDNPSDEHRCHDLGANGFFTKGVGPNAIHDNLVSVLDRMDRLNLEKASADADESVRRVHLFPNKTTQ